MENASKALIMAAGVLIAVSILSLAVYLITTFGATSAEVQAQNEENAISEFNSKFTVYDGRTDITIYDIITVANYAKQNNDNYNFSSKPSGDAKNFYYIEVKLDKKSIETNNTEKNDELLKQELINVENNVKNAENKKTSNTSKYSCTVEISSVTKRVYKVTFTKK